MQVVVLQLNFVERSVSPVALYDRDSNSGSYSYYKPSHIRAMFAIVCNLHVSGSLSLQVEDPKITLQTVQAQ